MLNFSWALCCTNELQSFLVFLRFYIQIVSYMDFTSFLLWISVTKFSLQPLKVLIMVDYISSVLWQENMTVDYDERFLHGKPQNSFHKAVNIPDVVVFPRFEHFPPLV